MDQATYKISCPFCGAFCGVVREPDTEVRCSRLWNYEDTSGQNKRVFRRKRYKVSPQDPDRNCLDWAYVHRPSHLEELSRLPKWLKCVEPSSRESRWKYDPISHVWHCQFLYLRKLCRGLKGRTVYVWHPLPEDVGWGPGTLGPCPPSLAELLRDVQVTLEDLVDSPRLRAHPATTRTAGHRGPGTLVVPVEGRLGPTPKQFNSIKGNPLVTQVVIAGMPGL